MRPSRALDIWKDGRSPEQTQAAIANEVERIYRQEGMPASVRELKVSKEDFPAIAQDSVKIFNSNAGLRDPENHIRGAIAMLEAAW